MSASALAFRKVADHAARVPVGDEGNDREFRRRSRATRGGDADE